MAVIITGTSGANRLVRGFVPAGNRWARGRPGPASAEQREGAQGDARDDGGAPGDLRRADRVSEHDDARHGADERLEVEEGAGHLGRYPALPVGEERERQQRAPGRQGDGGQDRGRAVRDGRQALRGRREQQRRQGRAQELHGRDRDRVAAGQQAGLCHGEPGRQQQRHEDQAIAGGRGAAALAAGDQADASQ